MWLAGWETFEDFLSSCPWAVGSGRGRGAERGADEREAQEERTSIQRAKKREGPSSISNRKGDAKPMARRTAYLYVTKDRSIEASSESRSRQPGLLLGWMQCMPRLPISIENTETTQSIDFAAASSACLHNALTITPTSINTDRSRAADCWLLWLTGVGSSSRSAGSLIRASPRRRLSIDRRRHQRRCVGAVTCLLGWGCSWLLLGRRSHAARCGGPLVCVKGRGKGVIRLVHGLTHTHSVSCRVGSTGGGGGLPFVSGIHPPSTVRAAAV